MLTIIMETMIVAKKSVSKMEQYYVDPKLTHFNSSPTYLIKNRFAQYFQDVCFKPKNEKEQAQQACMVKIYSLLASFEPLERLVANPDAIDPKAAKIHLKNSLQSWQTSFLKQLETFDQDDRSKMLIEALRSKIQINTANFLHRLNDEKDLDLRAIFAAHDLDAEMSLGHLIASQLDCILATSIKLCYHYSPYPLCNLLYLDRAISSLSDAKKDLHMQNFSLEGHFRTTAVHPYADSMLARLNPEQSSSTEFVYPLPQNNPSAAERLYRIKNDLIETTKPLYASAFWQTGIKIILSVVDLLFLSLVAINLITYVTLFCLNLVSFKVFNQLCLETHQKFLRILNCIYTLLSPLDHYQAYENECIKHHWRSAYPEIGDSLDASLLKQNYIQDLLNSIQFNVSMPSAKHISFASFNETYLSKIDISISPSTKTNQIEYQPENHFTSAVEMIGEIILLVDNYGVEASFRKAPLISTAGFCVSMLTLTAFLNPGLIIPGSKLLIAQLQHLINQLNLAFCGKPANIGLSEEIIGIFLTWQLNGMILDMPIAMFQERLGWAEDSHHETSKLITQLALLAAFAYGIGQLNPLEINWDKLTKFHCCNEIAKHSVGVLLDFINLIIDETHACLDGELVLANTTQMLITIKGLLVLKNWLSGHELHQPEGQVTLPAITPKPETLSETSCPDHDLALKQFLHALAYHDKALLEHSKQSQFAQVFYLELKSKLKLYNQMHQHQLDADILLDNYFNLYCQSTYLNLCKLLIVPYVLLSLAEFLIAHLYSYIFWQQEDVQFREIYTIRAQKHLEGAILMFIQSIYYTLHMPSMFGKVVYNYLLIGSIRAIVNVIGGTAILIEACWKKQAFTKTQSYLSLSRLDDSISEWKIRNQFNQILQPIYNLTASLAQSTGIYDNLGSIAAKLLRDISSQESIVQKSPKNLVA